MMKKLMIATILAASFGSVAIPAVADTRVVVVRQAPPPPRDEMVPTPRHGYVWAPGYWNWSHNRHVWVRGHWERSRRGYVYHAPAWEERDGQWHMHRGSWDRDGDGVPNRLDEHPDNPNRH
jgi:hypothetical protein